MKPDKEGTELLEDFFNMLGYGYKCTRCQGNGKIRKVTKDTVHFHCKGCDIYWGFEINSIIKDITKIKKLDNS